MNFKGCYRHPMNRLALGFFIAALVCFGVFHFMPMEGNSRIRGWVIWDELYELIKRGGWRDLNLRLGFGFGSFLGMSFLVVASPFLLPFVCNSRLVRWLLTIISFAALAGFGAFMAMRSPLLVLWWLFASQAFNFFGCLFLRRPMPEEFVPARHPDE